MFQGFGLSLLMDGKNSDHHQRKRKRKPTEVPDIIAIQQSLVQHFEDIKYLRAERTKKYLLTDILLYYTYQLSWLGK